MDKSIGLLARVGINLAALFIFIVGAIFRVDLMFLMALALALLPAIVWSVGWMFSGGISCTRSVPASCGVGDVIPMTLTLTNTARLPRPALRFLDVLPRGIRPVSAASGIVFDLRPGEARQVTYDIEAQRRGLYQLSLARLESMDPLGFYSFIQRCSAPAEIAIYPRLLPLRRVFWEDSAVRGGQSQEFTQRRGAGLEFHGVREYQPGDELRHVHWRTTARTGRLSVTEYAQGASLATTVALDLSRAAYARLGEEREAALDRAVTLAASLCAHLIRRGGSVRLLTAQDADDSAPPTSGSAALAAILEKLVGAAAEAERSLMEVLRQAPVLTAPGQTLVCITPAGFLEVVSQFPAGQPSAGGALFGLQIVASQNPALPSSGAWRVVAPESDLIQVLEGF